MKGMIVYINKAKEQLWKENWERDLAWEFELKYNVILHKSTSALMIAKDMKTDFLKV